MLAAENCALSISLATLRIIRFEARRAWALCRAWPTAADPVDTPAVVDSSEPGPTEHRPEAAEAVAEAALPEGPSEALLASSCGCVRVRAFSHVFSSWRIRCRCSPGFSATVCHISEVECALFGEAGKYTLRPKPVPSWVPLPCLPQLLPVSSQAVEEPPAAIPPAAPLPDPQAANGQGKGKPPRCVGWS